MHPTRRITKLPNEILREPLIQATQELIIAKSLEVKCLSFEDVISKSRKLDIIMTRHIISYLLSVNPDRSFAQIGKVFMKDHATAIHSRNVIEDMFENNSSLRFTIQIIATLIKN